MNKLFVLCPESQLEESTQTHFGKNSFFLTYLGMEVDLQSTYFVDSIEFLIEHLNIRTIYLVVDTSQSINPHLLQSSYRYQAESLKKRKLQASTLLVEEDVLVEEEDAILSYAKVIFNRLYHHIMQCEDLGYRIVRESIGVKGLLYDRELDSFKEMDCKKAL